MRVSWWYHPRMAPLRRMVSSELFAIVFLGLCFMVSLTSDFTISNMQKVLVSSIHEDNPNYNVNGNLSFGLVYLVYALFLWCVPSFIAVIGPKFGLVVGAVCVLCLVFSYSLQSAWATYVGVILGGIGGSLIWVSQGSFMIMTSTPNTIHRNVGVVWMCYSCAMIFGNLLAASEIRNGSRLDGSTRRSLIYQLCGIGIVGIVLFLFLPQPFKKKGKKPRDSLAKKDSLEEQTEERPKLTPVQALKKTWEIFCTVEMQFLIMTFIYVGFQQSFGHGLYSSTLGFTNKFGTIATELVPVSGLVYGLGELIGGIVFLCAARLLKEKPAGRYLGSGAMTIGIVLQIFAYITMFINIPSSASFGKTNESPILSRPRAWLALMDSFMMGVGDSFLNTQIVPLIAKLQPEYSPQTCALYKFTKSISMACYFFLSTCMNFHVQVIVNTCLGLVGVVTFLVINRKIVADHAD